MPRECPSCGASLAADAGVCRECRHVLDPERWAHDAGRLGPDPRDAGREPGDAPVGPIPLTAGGMTGGAFGSALRAVGGFVLARGRRAR